MSQDLTQEQVDAIGQELVANAETEEAVKNEEIQVSQEEALILRYEQLRDVVVKMSTQLTSRAMGRVMRAVVRYPFERTPKFENGVEKMAFDAFVGAEDLKMHYINLIISKKEAENKQLQEGLQQAAQASSEVTESGESQSS